MITPEAGVAVLAVGVAVATVVAFRVARRRWAVSTAIVPGTLMAVQWVAADAGIFADWDRRPPPLMLLVVAMSALTIVTALRVGPDLLAAVLVQAALFGHVVLWQAVARRDL